MLNADIGLIGLAVMGQNLALNMAGKGFRVAVYNRTVERVDEFVNGIARGANIIPAHSPEELVMSLKRPRRIMLMVKAGDAVDAVIEQLVPLLDDGDLIVDGGNSFFKDTIRREKALKEHGILFLGTGISGGEEGALRGPSIMPGGAPQAWDLMGEILLRISAKAPDGEPCCAYLGPDGAGHFVKMVHNGIEYGDMQLIAEAYHLMSALLGMSANEISEVLARWNEGELGSYLIEITSYILNRVDEETGRPLVDVILDEAEQKGTGKWTSRESLDLGVPVPTITEAVFARFMSGLKEERVRASSALRGPELRFGDDDDREGLINDIGRALFASKICAYAQGFSLLRSASKAYGWNLDLGVVAKIWRGGCIIRARFLDRIREAYIKDKELPNLLLDDYFRRSIEDSQASWRKVVSFAAIHGIPVPAFSSALGYFDAYRTERLPANLLQAQRDYFGAHTYRRLDKPGSFHTEWVL